MRAVLFALGISAVGMILPAARAEVVVIALPQPEGFFTTFPFSVRYPIDLNGDSTADFTFSYHCTGVALRTERANRVVYRIAPPPNLGGRVQRLPEGFLISSELGTPGLDWGSSDQRDGYVSPGEKAFMNIVLCLSTGCASTWPPGPLQRGFIGLEFELADGLHYGYFDVSVSGSVPAASLYGWAYESRPGVPIKAGAKPVLVPMAAPQVARAGYLRLKWPSEVGKAYQVQARTRMDALTWTSLSFVIPATATETMVDVPMIGAAGFFRVIEAD